MTGVFIDATFGLLAAVTLVLAFVVAARVLVNARQRRRAELQPRLELLVAEYLAVDEAPLPRLPRERAAAAVFVEVCRAALAELRGREHERLVELLDRSGRLDHAAGELAARSTRRRRYAAETLALAAAGRLRDVLVAGLGDRDRHVRLTCARALAELGDDARLLPVLERDADKASGATADVLLALAGKLPKSVGRIAAATSSSGVRALALAVIGELRLSDEAPLLRQALASADDEVAARAARGLGLIGDVEAVPALEGLLEEGQRSWFVKAAAAKALGAIGDPSAVRPLEWQLRDDAWHLKTNAAEALARLGDEGLAALRRAAASSRGSVRDVARAALDR